MSAFVLWCSVVYIASTVPFTQAIQCQGTAKYTLTFQAEWTSQSHPNDFPSGSSPHFSVLVGCSHKADYVMWKPGINATTGVENVAEFGMNKQYSHQKSGIPRRMTLFYAEVLSNDIGQKYLIISRNNVASRCR